MTQKCLKTYAFRLGRNPCNHRPAGKQRGRPKCNLVANKSSVSPYLYGLFDRSDRNTKTEHRGFSTDHHWTVRRGAETIGKPVCRLSSSVGVPRRLSGTETCLEISQCKCVLSSAVLPWISPFALPSGRPQLTTSTQSTLSSCRETAPRKWPDARCISFSKSPKGRKLSSSTESSWE